MLRVDGLSARVGDFNLSGVTLSVEDSAYFVLLGPSGAGKTVLLETIAGLVPPNAGRILWDGQDVGRTPIQKRGMGLVYQDQSLFPHLSVRRNIAYGPRARGRSREAIAAQVEALAAEVGVAALLDRYPATLSGGEAQRVALARALATEPKCLLLDEPLSSLDSHARVELRALLRDLHRKGQTVVHVTHDHEEAVSLATHVGVIENGSILQTGTPEDVFHHPKSEFVARFTGIQNVLEGQLEKHETTNNGLAVFASGPARFRVRSDARPGPGAMILRNEDITVSGSRPNSCAENCFAGTVVDIVPARLGVGVCIDIGVEMNAFASPAAVKKLGLRDGREVWLSFKAGDARFIEA